MKTNRPRSRGRVGSYVAKCWLVIASLGLAACENRDDTPPLDPPSPESQPIASAQSPWSSSVPYTTEVLDTELTDTDREVMTLRNWRTGSTFTESEVKRLKFLRSALPGNRSLMAFDPAEREELREQEAENTALGRRIDAGSGTAAQISAYYEFKAAYYDDRIEALQFVLGEPSWDPETRTRYERYVSVAKKERAKLVAQQEAALSRARQESQG